MSQCVFKTIATASYSSDVATFTAADIGTPGKTRNVLIWVLLAATSGTPSDNATILVGTKAATRVSGSSATFDTGFGIYELCCFVARVPSDATADIKVTSAGQGSTGNALIGIVVTYGVLATASDSACSVSSPASLDCDVTAGAAVSAFSLVFDTSSAITMTWSGVDEDVDSVVSGVNVSEASFIATGGEAPRTITGTPSATPDELLLASCVVFPLEPFVSSVRNLKVNARGRCGIWNGDDDLPYKYPRQHLDRVKFHTDLDYIKIVREIPLILSLPQRDTATYGVAANFTHKLFDHGLGGFPFVLGETVVNGEAVAMCGSIPIQADGVGYYGQWLALGADDTSVYIHEYDVFPFTSASGLTTSNSIKFPAIDIPITVYLTDELLDVDSPRPPVGQATELSFRGARFADGLFDTNNRYIRQVSDPANKTLNMARGPTIEITTRTSGVNTDAAWRWRVNAATQVGLPSGAMITPPDGFNTPLDISLGGPGTPGKRGDFSARAGRIYAKGPLGRTVFDTDDGLFHTIDKLSGSISVATASVSSGTNVNNTGDVDLGPCDPNCTDVIGSIKFTLNNYDAGMAYDRWHSMFGGSSALWLIDGHNLIGSNPDPNTNILEMVWYSFLIIDGRVILRRRFYVSQNSRGTYSVLSHQIDYKLKMGLFT